MTYQTQSTRQSNIDPALRELLDLMTMHSQGRQTRSLAIFLASPRGRR